MNKRTETKKSKQTAPASASANAKRSNGQKVPKSATEVIILNKPFLGGWLNSEGHIAHEIIDFLRDDNGRRFIYGLHSGACRDDIWIGKVEDEFIPNKNAPIICEDGKPLQRIAKEKVAARYLVLTSASKKKKPQDRKNPSKRKREHPKYTFNILYVVVLKEKLQRMTGCDRKKKEELWRNNLENTRKLVQNLDIKYNNKFLTDCFHDDWNMVVTFEAEEIYEAKVSIPFSLPYQWRNKGYVWNRYVKKNGSEGDNPDFMKLKRTIESAIADPSIMQVFDAKRVRKEEFNEEKFAKIEESSTFLDILSLQDYEQAYTNMLYAVLRVDHGIMMKEFFSFMRERGQLDDASIWKRIESKWKIIKVHKEWPAKVGTKDTNEEDDADKENDDDKGAAGRMDVCADIFDAKGKKLIQRVIIENKIDSGLNGRDKEKKISQLNTYYKWGRGAVTDEAPMLKKPICIVIAPTYRIEDIKREIKDIDEKNKSHKDKMGQKYMLLDYGFVADFIDAYQEKIKNEIDSSFVKQFSQSFRKHSLEKRDDYAWRFFLKTK